jgi:hypothetical protein
MLRDHGAHVTLCVMSVQVGLLPMVLPTTQVSDLYHNKYVLQDTIKKHETNGVRFYGYDGKG